MPQKAKAAKTYGYMKPCGNVQDRARFYPPSSLQDRSANKTYFEYFLKYDLKQNITTRLEIENWSTSDDLVLHGLDIRQSDDNPEEIELFAVNHARQGERIATFLHTLGSSTLRFVKQYSHDLIVTPNGVAAAGPRSFFITNDHYFYNGTGRAFEEEFGPFTWASSVVYCEEKMGGLDCHIVSPNDAHPNANGISSADGGRNLIINDVDYGTSTVYAVDPRTKALVHEQTIIEALGGTPDNVFQIPSTGDLVVALIPNLTAVAARFEGGLLSEGPSVESTVLRLVKANNYTPQILYWDDGGVLSFVTSAVVDTKLKRMVMGGVYERHWAVCNIDI
ncbi:hypothetical protein DDE82_007685 [Stemphylium lycopersici]|nr:hypothetical protein TW65_01701 [Stemphylium lycopersici]RAR00019.1 hypothetical protein DDE82_007685 [Stemphylium lycopersici]